MHFKSATYLRHGFCGTEIKETHEKFRPAFSFAVWNLKESHAKFRPPHFSRLTHLKETHEKLTNEAQTFRTSVDAKMYETAPQMLDAKKRAVSEAIESLNTGLGGQ